MASPHIDSIYKKEEIGRLDFGLNQPRLSLPRLLIWLHTDMPVYGEFTSPGIYVYGVDYSGGSASGTKTQERRVDAICKTCGESFASTVVTVE